MKIRFPNFICHGAAARNTMNLVHPIVPDNFVGCDIPLPNANRSSFRRKRKTRSLLQQYTFSAIRFGAQPYVFDDRRQALDIAGAFYHIVGRTELERLARNFFVPRPDNEDDRHVESAYLAELF